MEEATQRLWVLDLRETQGFQDASGHGLTQFADAPSETANLAAKPHWMQLCPKDSVQMFPGDSQSPAETQV